MGKRKTRKVCKKHANSTKSNQIKYSFIDKKDNPPDTNVSGFYRRVGGGKNTNN